MSTLEMLQLSRFPGMHNDLQNAPLNGQRHHQKLSFPTLTMTISQLILYLIPTALKHPQLGMAHRSTSHSHPWLCLRCQLLSLSGQKLPSRHDHKHHHRALRFQQVPSHGSLPVLIRNEIGFILIGRLALIEGTPKRPIPVLSPISLNAAGSIPSLVWLIGSHCRGPISTSAPTATALSLLIRSTVPYSSLCYVHRIGQFLATLGYTLGIGLLGC